MSKTVQTPEEIADALKLVEHEKAIEAKKAALRKEHGIEDVFVLKVDDAVAYLKKPGRKEVGMSRAMGEGDYMKTQELLLDSIWLEGDEIIRTNDDYFLNVIPHLEGLIELKKVELKKN